MKTFLKSTEVKLINGGYVSSSEGKAVTNSKFIEAQIHAEYVVTFAKLAKGKDFKGTKADSLEKLTQEVKDALAVKKTVYVSGPKKVVKKLTQQLADEAMAFMSFEKDTSKADKINSFLEQFNVLHEFEEFGLFFKDGIVKLNKVYTMKEVIAAVEETIDILK
jgi:hypothetical protein